MPSDALKVVGSFPAVYQVGVWQNVSITAWFGKATLPAARELAQITEHTVALMAGQRVSVIYLVAEEFGLPDSETREVIAQILRDNGHHVGCLVVVLSGTGFWVSAMRGVVTSLRVVAPRALDLRVHARAEELHGWFPAEHKKRTGMDIDLDAFQRVLESVTSWQEHGRAAIIRG
ncbi:MAG TPA: hypothetical protein VFG30_34235 [Polyangiales bacterium]|nr:hypothetical protein [Polyangiales bacterium]